jgi:hypothetical protein
VLLSQIVEFGGLSTKCFALGTKSISFVGQPRELLFELPSSGTQFPLRETQIAAIFSNPGFTVSQLDQELLPQSLEVRGLRSQSVALGIETCSFVRQSCEFLFMLLPRSTELSLCET